VILRGIALALLAALVPPSAGAVSINWEDEFADEAVIANGTQVTASDGVVVTFTTTVFSDSDGGTFDLTPQAGNADFVTAESSPLGNHSGLVQLAFDNQNDDPADYVQVRLTFSNPVYGLAFTVLDVDSSSGTTWDDGLLFTFNGGINIVSDPSLYTLPAVPLPTIELDNEPGYVGFEGVNNRTATDTETTGNLAVDFGATGGDRDYPAVLLHRRRAGQSREPADRRERPLLDRPGAVERRVAGPRPRAARRHAPLVLRARPLE